jgi:hypothetical protein
MNITFSRVQHAKHFLLPLDIQTHWHPYLSFLSYLVLLLHYPTEKETKHHQYLMVMNIKLLQMSKQIIIIWTHLFSAVQTP